VNPKEVISLMDYSKKISFGELLVLHTKQRERGGKIVEVFFLVQL